MSLPPFPSQDLAKLVLGYLAEEQLMTAYDEFLQASPYLDALENEYDRIFMTSLKNILAEYRAVKIIVETCKPFILRRKLFQCTNLLEIVKFLIQHVDLNKIQDNNQTKFSQNKSNNGVNNITCEVCKSLKQDICTCNKQLHGSNVEAEAKSLDNSLETTALSDLPGNHVTCSKKNAKVLNDEVSDLNVSEQKDKSKNTLADDEVAEKTLPNRSNTICSQMQITQNSCTQNYSLQSKSSESVELRQKEEFNTILHQVCNKDQSITIPDLNPEPVDKRISLGGYNDFATGVNGEGRNINVPDSSTSENLHVQHPVPKENILMPNFNSNTKPKQTRTQYLLKVANVRSTGKNEIVSIKTINHRSLPNVKSKTDENKIKIISDIKVDKSFNNDTHNALKMPAVLKNATSTPLLQMQTIVINGTPVYKHQPFGQTQNYTKDEIMAMPTIILAPVTCTSHIPASEQTTVSTSFIRRSHSTTTTSTTARQLGPLVIDVASSSSTLAQKTSEQICCVTKNKESIDGDLPKNLDVISASAPKDNTVVGITETSTPQILPPLRKSSSTPRRTSHVRVLDFATPRRILHETVNKCVPNTTTDNEEVVISKSPSLNIPFVPDKNVNDTFDSKVTSKENSTKNKLFKKRNNWDADLRALAVISEKNIETDVTPTNKSKSKPKSTRKRTSKKESTKKENDSNEEEKSTSKKKTNKSKTTKKNLNMEEVSEIDVPCEKVDISKIKPTINIIAGTDRSLSTSDDKVQNKSNSDNVDTPEMERLSLQNDIGAKLNISDLLETPYKQVLYDIQMETPRFLGPDIPDVDPMSDIKIMNIPTPRFLAAAATPSSYSSRPTDYSSGGSYYKPDEQDYMRIHDDIICPVSSTKDNQNTNISSSLKFANNEIKNKSDEKPSRPVRKCTKNVSYYNSNINKTKEVEEKDTIEITSSETENESFNESIVEKEQNLTVKDSKTRTSSSSKADSKKRRATKKQKTPVKKDVSKSFMKIRPRRPTPTKNTGRKSRKASDPSKVQTRKKAAASNESSVNATPVVVAAPTKSRRKSSTPRKLHCTKSFISESSGHDSPELLPKDKENRLEINVACTQDSDTEQLPLCWSDDGSQDSKPKETKVNVIESEDITKIQEFINTAVLNHPTSADGEGEGSLHIDLVKRGFDLETAKIIERDLLDVPQQPMKETESKNNLVVTTSAAKVESKVVVVEEKFNTVLEKSLESDCGTGKNLHIVQDEEGDDDDEIELSVQECNEGDTNYITCSHEETKDLPINEPVKLKDKFSMEVCLDDDLSIRLRATPFTVILDQDQQNEAFSYNYKETEIAVSSISNIEKLYTPLKDAIKAQCYEIFDSTLTSIDTPLKVSSPKRKEAEISVTEIVLENEKVDPKKRKRVQSGNISDECVNESKKARPEAQYLFNSANIQNIDIESVLSKLHGP